MSEIIYKVGIGTDSHRFIEAEANREKPSPKPLILAGLEIASEDAVGLEGNSDADVILHAVTDAISSITGINIIGELTDKLAKSGLTSSAYYLNIAKEHLSELHFRIVHLAVAIEAKRPRLEPHIPAMKQNLARLLEISPADVGITVTSGEGLSDYGRGLGIKAVAIITVMRSSIRPNLRDSIN